MSNRLIEVMCGKKVSFRTELAAKERAAQFNQRTYSCPICFCWHNTSKEKHEQYVTLEYMQGVLKKREHELSEQYRQNSKILRAKLHEANLTISKLKHLNKKLCNHARHHGYGELDIARDLEESEVSA